MEFITDVLMITTNGYPCFLLGFICISLEYVQLMITNFK
ncbi:hypothetical protein I600_3167 [Maribacter dokdonensis DSW-8]|nr:hypothetical protein I600_3167 [Maribacter dokdonensis DSW-8]